MSAFLVDYLRFVLAVATLAMVLAVPGLLCLLVVAIFARMTR